MILAGQTKTRWGLDGPDFDVCVSSLPLRTHLTIVQPRHNFLQFNKLDPIPVYLLMAVIEGAVFGSFAVIASVYRITEAGLNPLELILVGTVLEAAVFLFENPTGVVADVFSRRLSLIIGFALIGAGIMLEGLFPLFGTILLAQAVWGIGYTFTSGARQAWLADELGDDGGVGDVFLRGSQVAQSGRLFGIGLTVVLASAFIALPLIIGGAVMFLLAFVLAFAMPERGFTPTPRAERETWRSMKTTLGSGLTAVRMHHVLMAIIAIELFSGASSEPFDRLWATHMLDSFEFPTIGSLNIVVWFGIIEAIGLAIGTGTTWVIRRTVDVDSPGVPLRFLSITNGLIMAAALVFVLSGNFALSVIMVVFTSLIRRISEPVVYTWLNQMVESRNKATVFSLHSQANAIGQVAVGPVIGAMARL
jgi:DHA3 family tetracycline resistance protein-like MFS transporter